ncbi:MAG TPA: hypothetical protein VG502_05575 [Flexivirga sp.]|uniref:hypothetical protein n=1 Tax=Flexivirga sp. TaxID=1962927 RepID=UPI002B895551|nr:hypothetical protein [Flexivirga sp.]HWC21749.1 hypothetical protein [Flexivirga sp.]
MTEWEWEAAAAGQLLDVQIYAADGEPVGKVDDLEFTRPPGGGAPVLTALLCGSTAFGPRVGGLIGLFVWAVGRRLSPDGGEPVRVPLAEVQTVNRREIRLRETAPADELRRLTNWTRDNVIRPIPGGSR